MGAPISGHDWWELSYEVETGGEWNGWRTDTESVDISGFSNDYVMLGVVMYGGGLAVDYVKILDANGNVLRVYDFTGAIRMEQTGTYWDYGLLRKYVSPEPSHGAWGLEETLP
jgi:hypothetical protein